MIFYGKSCLTLGNQPEHTTMKLYDNIVPYYRETKIKINIVNF